MKSDIIEIKKNKIEYFILIVFRLLIIISIVQNFIHYNSTNILKAGGTLLLTYIPIIISNKIRINLIPEFHIIVQLFIFFAVYIGGYYKIYYKVSWLDVSLHGIRGFLLGFTGFILIFMLNKDEIKNNISRTFIIMFMMSFSALVTIIWETFEFLMDLFFNAKMQIFGLSDTMWDLIADSIGAITASLIIYIYLKTNKKNYIIILLNKFFTENSKEFIN